MTPNRTLSLAPWIIAPTLVAAASGVASIALLLGGGLNRLGPESLFLGTLPIFLLPVAAQIVVLWRWARPIRRSLLLSAVAALLVQVTIGGLVMLDQLFDLSMLGMRGAGQLSGLIYWWVGAVITAAIVGVIQARAFHQVVPNRVAVGRVSALSALGALLAIVVVLIGFLTLFEVVVPRAPEWMVWLILPIGSALAWAIHLTVLGLEVRKGSLVVD